MAVIEPQGHKILARRVVLAGILLAVLALAAWAVLFGSEGIRRELASRQLIAAIESTPNGGVLDISTAYDVPWDRAVVVGPYWNGAAANSALGFDYYPPDESVTPDDNASLLLMVRDQTVLSELRLAQTQAFFEDGFEGFTPAADHFTVVRKDGSATLVHE